MFAPHTHKTQHHDTLSKTDDGGCDLFRRTATQSEFALNCYAGVSRGQLPYALLSWRVPERERTVPSLPKPQTVRACGHCTLSNWWSRYTDPSPMGVERWAPPNGESGLRRLVACKRCCLGHSRRRRDPTRVGMLSNWVIHVI